MKDDGVIEELAGILDSRRRQDFLTVIEEACPEDQRLAIENKLHAMHTELCRGSLIQRLPMGKLRAMVIGQAADLVQIAQILSQSDGLELAPDWMNGTGWEVGPDWMKECIEELGANRVVGAIKICRDSTGLIFEDAKKVIKNVMSVRAGGGTKFEFRPYMRTGSSDESGGNVPVEDTDIPF